MIPRSLLAFMLVIAASTALAAEAPLTLKEIGKLRLERKSNAQIIELAKERGLAFMVDKDAAGTLRAMQFKADEVELLAKIADGSYEQELKKQAEEEAKAEAERPKAPKAGAAPPGVTIGPRITNAAHETIAKRAMRIKEASNTNTKVFPTETVTLICSEKTSKTHLPNLQKLEVEIRKRFGEPTKTGTDKRSAYIVLLDNRYDYERWVKAMFKVYESDGIRWTTPNALDMALKGPAFLTPTMTVVDLSALTPEAQLHEPIFCFGYLYSEQLMEGRSPDAATNGFGNVCETILFGSPMIRLYSYMDRDLAAKAQPWLQVVRERLEKRTLSTIDKIMRFSTASMEPDEYCEAWSLIAFLSSQPELYNRWITRRRDTKEKPLEALLAVYGKTEAELTKDWHTFIQKQN